VVMKAEIFIGLGFLEWDMPDWEPMAPVIRWRGWVSVHNAPCGVARNSPIEGAGVGRSSDENLVSFQQNAPRRREHPEKKLEAPCES
jgi:hypothetical protein